MTWIGDVLQLRPIEGRLTVAERAACIEVFVRLARAAEASEGTQLQAENADDVDPCDVRGIEWAEACGQVAVALGCPSTSDRERIRAALTFCRVTCAAYAQECEGRAAVTARCRDRLVASRDCEEACAALLAVM